jgi:hypothetical protein
MAVLVVIVAATATTLLVGLLARRLGLFRQD